MEVLRFNSFSSEANKLLNSVYKPSEHWSGELVIGQFAVALSLAAGLRTVCKQKFERD